MTTFQKVIKYIAIAFAIWLIVNIVSGILLGIGAIAAVFGLRKTITANLDHLEQITSDVEIEDITTLKIDLNSSNLKIQKGEQFKAESNSTAITCTQNKKQLVIKEKNNNWFNNKDVNEVVVYIPENFNFDGVKITTGAGETYIEELNTKELSFEIGAGKVQIDNLNVSEKAKIECGAGKISVNLNDDMSNYTIKADKGLGSIKINNKEIANTTEYGNGSKNIDIDCGVGAIEINSNK